MHLFSCKMDPQNLPTYQPRRGLTDPVILTTLPHLLALCFVLGKARGSSTFAAYAAIITASSLLSVAWHAQHERKTWVFWADYAFAMAWTLMDFYVAATTQPSALSTVAGANATVLVANWLTDHWARQGVLSYVRGHSLWHLFSCVKSLYVAYVLGR